MGIDGSEYKEDYGQYKPRGHYTRSEDLQRYFQAMMWYGRITFRLRNADETRSALLLTQALQTAKGNSGTSAADDVGEHLRADLLLRGRGRRPDIPRLRAPDAAGARRSATDPKAVS